MFSVWGLTSLKSDQICYIIKWSTVVLNILFHFNFSSVLFTTGIGMNLISFSSIMVLRGYFLKMLPLAYGTCLAGVGVGMVSFPPLYVYLHMTFGLKGSFLIVSAICLNSAVFSGLTIPTKAQSQSETRIYFIILCLDIFSILE